MSFHEWQPEYASRGIAVFPLKADKTPAMTSYNKLGVKGSAEIASRPQFAKACAMGFMTNARNRIAVLDIDTTNEGVLADAPGRHGDTPIMVRTASGKHHAWYKYNGERRRIRPFDGLPIDLLGAGGLVVAPPSEAKGNTYSFIEGGLDDIDRLPVMRGLEHDSYVGHKDVPTVVPDDVLANDNEPAAPDFLVPDGRRGNEFWRFCMRKAHGCETLDMLLSMARQFNEEQCVPPITEDRVVSAAASAWQYTERGLNRFGQHGSWLVTDDVRAMVGDPYLLALVSFLKATNKPDSRFWVADGLAEVLEWPRERFQAARRRAIETGWITPLTVPKPGKPVYYKWGTAHERESRAERREGC
jgi:Bifunctional DNA primase/polymerase, N-terminal